MPPDADAAAAAAAKNTCPISPNLPNANVLAVIITQPFYLRFVHSTLTRRKLPTIDSSGMEMKTVSVLFEGFLLIVRDFSDSLMPTTIVSPSGGSITILGINKHFFGSVEAASGLCRAVVLPKTASTRASVADLAWTGVRSARTGGR